MFMSVTVPEFANWKQFFFLQGVLPGEIGHTINSDFGRIPLPPLIVFGF